MKREVIGYIQLSNVVLNQKLESAPFFFSSPSATMLGAGIEDEFTGVIPFSQLAEKATSMLQKAKKNEQDNPILFGIVPFSEENPSRFLIPNQLYVSSSTRAEQKVDSSTSAPGKLVSSPTGERYKQGVLDAIGLFSSTELSKVVLSRAIEVGTDEDIDQLRLLKNMLAINSTGYTFAASLENGNKMMGASPELLVARKGSNVISNPLAGSLPSSDDVAVNSVRSEQLLNSGKDLYEHGFVVEEVERVLNKYCHSLYTPMVPSVIKTKTMLHLSTVLEGQMNNPEISVLQLASELHPTPAVCGYPRQTAYKAIRDIEKYDRGYFTGMVGWCDSRGNGEWVVTIRCAEVQKRSMKVFAGAGIVSQSQPQSELDETGAKMSTILSAAGIELNDILVA
ncbi:isochorismate synthase [Vibrio viridaestus]|uniref:isochorismate synthase n=1 Tax=Vibrio viridaestus TaxID=2487322 RepID=A0A3N9TCC4_9VIBR|nr:isochorismate synthase [Vibrio viridaestus]RQW61484.1 isochorismate synthase [Vibrio viridaestus]